MLRITELRLPLDHPQDALRPAVLARLGIADADLLSLNVFRRAYDARKKTAIVLIYTVDCEVRDEAAVLQARQGDSHLKPTPDTRYKFVGHAPADFFASERQRPLVVGF
ncbi:MAG: dependent oxidoreductase, partial [Ramlibacter sp.]|nr:dependent oxidoreductase [Ramlibacter sp.]